jgi:preprotein translocase subunit SecD
VASSSAPVHPARYLSVFLLLLVGVYLLVFLTGDKRAAPKLGIDLQGGTRVTLTARTPDGSKPSREALAQAQQIIGARVNGLGVSGSEVVVDGDNLIITVPGNDGNEARNLGQTARLYIRPVLNSMPAQSAEPKPPARQPAGGKPAPGQPAPGQPAPAQPAPGQPAPAQPRSRAALSVTSTARVHSRSPPSSSFSVARPASLRSTAPTRHPLPWNSFAPSRPMPLPAPVMKTDFTSVSPPRPRL